MKNQELMDDVLAGAFEGGINHWVNDATLISSDEPRGDVYSETFYTPKNFVWQLNTIDGPVLLTSEKLSSALSKYDGDPEDWDAGDYDNIVQEAVYGELYYC